MFLNYVDPLIDLFNWDKLADLNIFTVLFRLFLAVLCGGILGFERATKHHAAGFRTYILVCLGSTIAMLTNEFLTLSTNTGDPARLGAQVISGIGFLGAGTILITSRNQIKGLTTAAGLWGCACLGLSIGVGFYTVAIFGALFIVVIFAILPKIEDLLTRRSKGFDIHIEFISKENLKDFIEYARNNNFQIYSLEKNDAYEDSGLSVYTMAMLDLDKKRKNLHSEFIKCFDDLPYVYHVEEIGGTKK